MILGHNEYYFTNNYSKININFLKKLKNKKITKKIGISVYSKKKYL